MSDARQTPGEKLFSCAYTFDSLSYTHIMPGEKRFTEVRRIMEQAGWTLVRINGSHHVFEKAGEPRPFPVPVHSGKVAGPYVQKAEKFLRKHQEEQDAKKN